MAAPSLFLHRISVVRVYLSIAATTQDPAGQDPQQGSSPGKPLNSYNSRASFTPLNLSSAFEKRWLLWMPWACSDLLLTTVSCGPGLGRIPHILKERHCDVRLSPLCSASQCVTSVTPATAHLCTLNSQWSLWFSPHHAQALILLSSFVFLSCPISTLPWLYRFPTFILIEYLTVTCYVSQRRCLPGASLTSVRSFVPLSSLAKLFVPCGPFFLWPGRLVFPTALSRSTTLSQAASA